MARRNKQTRAAREGDVALTDRRFETAVEARRALVAAGYHCGFTPSPAPDLYHFIKDGVVSRDAPMAVAQPKKGSDKRWRIVSYPVRQLVEARKAVEDYMRGLAKRRATEERRQPQKKVRHAHAKADDSKPLDAGTKLEAGPAKPGYANRKAIKAACVGVMTVAALCKKAKCEESELRIMLRKGQLKLAEE